jgi:hypothetical protein
MSMKNSSDIIGNQTHDLSVCGTVPQTTAPPRAANIPSRKLYLKKLMSFSSGIPMVAAYEYEQFSESSFYEKESLLPWTHGKKKNKFK